MKFTSILPVSCLATLAFGATISVTVGPGLVYSPDSVTANKGDVVQFHFGSGHNVVSGKFSSPCEPDNVIYSGNPNQGDVFSVTINNTEPVWIYCAVPSHCQHGMAMVINAPSNATIDDYKKAAASTSSSNAPAAIMGGVFGAQSSSSSSSSSASASSSSAAASASSAGATSASSTASASGGATPSSTSGPTPNSGVRSSGSTIVSTLMVLAVAFGLTM